MRLGLLDTCLGLILTYTAIFAVIVTFNEFLFALALTANPRAMTMPPT